MFLRSNRNRTRYGVVYDANLKKVKPESRGRTHTRITEQRQPESRAQTPIPERLHSRSPSPEIYQGTPRPSVESSPCPSVEPSPRPSVEPFDVDLVTAHWSSPSHGPLLMAPWAWPWNGPLDMVANTGLPWSPVRHPAASAAADVQQMYQYDFLDPSGTRYMSAIF